MVGAKEDGWMSTGARYFPERTGTDLIVDKEVQRLRIRSD